MIRRAFPPIQVAGWRHLVLAATLAQGLALGGCGGDDPAGPEGTGDLRIVTATTGQGLDPDGYSLVVDGGEARAIGINDQLTLTDLAVGQHTVQLTEAADNCTIGEPNPRTVAVTATPTVETSFEISCAIGALEVKLTASDGASGDEFGGAVSISGDYAVVGAALDDDNADESGSAYVFMRDGDTWTQQAKLIAGDGAVEANFGTSVSIDGDYAIVGAPRRSVGHSDGIGSAYVFRRNGESWVEEAKLTASDEASGDVFGNAVSIFGEYAIVGAEGDNFSQGAAYVFTREGTVWTEQAKLTASDGDPDLVDQFGRSVSLNGTYAVIGAFGSNSFQGAAYVFERTGTSWTEQSKLTASDGATDDFFGISVSLDGDYLVVGTRRAGAYVFMREGAIWTEQAKLTPSESDGPDFFGLSVSLEADFAVVGALGGQLQHGAVYIFKREGSTWPEQVKIQQSDGLVIDGFEIGDLFGISVSISGDYILAGAPRRDQGQDFNEDSGAAYVYR